MSSSDDVCTCWRVATDAEDSRPATWLSMHDRVVVTTTDGQRVEGRPIGALWFGFEEPFTQGFEIELDDGSCWASQLTEVESITPVAAPDREKIIQSLLHAIRHPLDLEEGREWHELIVDDHTTLEIEVAVRRKDCTPSSSPYPKFQIVVEQ
jgi:hypothetical protein